MKKLLICFLILPLISTAQMNIDSLWSVWNNQNQPDSSRLNAMLEISWEGYLFTQPDSAFYYAQVLYDEAKVKGNRVFMADALNIQGISFSIRNNYKRAIEYYTQGLKINEEIGNKGGTATALNNIGIVYKNQGDFSQAIIYYTKSLKITEEIGDRESSANAMNNIGVISQDQGDYARAIEYYIKSLKIREESGDKKGTAIPLNNIGTIYQDQGDYTRAMEYFTKSLKIREELDDQKGMATSFNNIGLVYKNQGDFTQAISYYSKSLKIREAIGDKKGTADALNNIGTIYSAQGNYTLAMDYYSKSLEITEAIKDLKGSAAALNNIGFVYQTLKNYPKAIESATKALKIAEEAGVAIKAEEAAKSLWISYKETNQFEKSLEMHELFIKTRDSLTSMNNQKEVIRQKFKYDYEKQAVADSIQNAEANKVKDAQLTAQKAENKQREQQAYLLYGGVSLALIFGGFIFNRFRVTNKQKGVIEQQKQQVDIAFEELEVKNDEIMESITYAKRIQSAILPSEKVIQKHLPNSFILYKPKDIVAGDFYWLEHKNNTIFFAAADCTGHGVPGAMVSVVCNNALNKSIREYNLFDPGLILDKTREIVVNEFAKSTDEVKDGMDIALCSLEGNVLTYAGANNPLWIVRKDANSIEEVKANKQPISQFDYVTPYTSHKVKLNQGDAIYLFSDGYVDQFGGEKGKKFKPSALREVILSIQEKSMEEQKLFLDNAFEKYRGNHQQVDDVCMIGVKFE